MANKPGYAVLYEKDKEIYVGVTNFLLISQPSPETFEYDRKIYNFSRVAPIPNGLESHICSFLVYSLEKNENKRACTKLK